MLLPKLNKNTSGNVHYIFPWIFDQMISFLDVYGIFFAYSLYRGVHVRRNRLKEHL